MMGKTRMSKSKTTQTLSLSLSLYWLYIFLALYKLTQEGKNSLPLKYIHQRCSAHLYKTLFYIYILMQYHILCFVMIISSFSS
jgi:hypothetical protein